MILFVNFFVNLSLNIENLSNCLNTGTRNNLISLNPFLKELLKHCNYKYIKERYTILYIILF